MMRSLAKSLGLGRLAYHLYHRPAGVIADSVRAGGPVEQWRTARGRAAMEAAADRLPPLATPSADAPVVHLLTGKRLWYQTAFFLSSLGRHLPVQPVIHDDGRLDPATVDRLRQVLPFATIVTSAESEALLDRHLPANKFPFLRARRDELVLFRKILDVHVGATGWRMFLDSDMLVFRRPDLLIDWWRAPNQCLHMTDVARAYGYDLPVLSALAGAPVPDLVNTGILGLRSEAIDWERMEWWCRTLIERHGTHYYQEQALIALHLASQPRAAIPRADYVVLPDEAEARHPRAVLHHYVAGSKRWYFQINWHAFADAPFASP